MKCFSLGNYVEMITGSRNVDESLRSIIFNPSVTAAYTISIISAALGLANCLKN